MPASATERVDRASDPQVPRQFAVVRRRPETADTVTLDLLPVDGRPLGFAPGQFTMISAFGYPEIPISISGGPAEPVLRHTVRAVGAASRAVAAADVGESLWVRGPFGQGWRSDMWRGRTAADSCRDVVLVTGGLGLAPLRPLVLELIAGRGRYRHASLLVGARTPADLLFGEELTEWSAALDVRVTVDAAGPGWRGRVGLVTGLLPRVSFDPAQTAAYLCGPEVMMRATTAALVKRGVPSSRIRLSVERNMRCGIGLCGHCQLREFFVCTDGPVFAADQLAPLMRIREL